MRKMKFVHVIAALLCILASVVFFIIGLLHRIFLLAAVCAIAGYIFIDRKYLRCPACGAFINLDHLFYARSHTYHCYNCGEVIEIDK